MFTAFCVIHCPLPPSQPKVTTEFPGFHNLPLTFPDIKNSTLLALSNQTKPNLGN